jgi:hypothetical protein
MTDEEIRDYLDDNGYPPHIVHGGRAGLVRRWRNFVAQVERGYPLGLEDYRNDLDTRAIILMAGAEDDEVLALDERLKAMLTHPEIRVWESAPGEPFWDFGYPQLASEDLIADLRAEELI